MTVPGQHRLSTKCERSLRAELLNVSEKGVTSGDQWCYITNQEQNLSNRHLTHLHFSPFVPGFRCCLRCNRFIALLCQLPGLNKKKITLPYPDSQ